MNMRMLLLLLSLATALARADETPADEAPSVAVSTRAVTQGELPRRLTAYGTATPATDAAETLSIQAAGQVERFEVLAGSAVKRGQPLLAFRLAPAAVAAYAQAVSALELARGQRQRTAQLLAQQLATRDQLAQADNALADAQSNLQALKQQHADRPRSILPAPYDGVVTAIQAVQGDQLAAGAPLLTLAREGGSSVDVGVEPAQRALLHVGAAVTLSPLDGGAALSGRVLRVADAVNPRSRLIDVLVAPDSTVTIGLAFKAEIEAGAWRGWLVPRDALIADGDRWRVFQVDHGKAVAVPVNIVGENDTTSAVTGPLVADRPLVVEGAPQLDDGMAVRPAAGDGSAQ